MIRVHEQPEPSYFHEEVRGKGRNWLDKHPAGEPEPYWRGKCLDDLGRAYKRICAYTCEQVSPVTGFASVDHFVAKNPHRDLAYEWSNYRFACGAVNARKGKVGDIPDPFLLPAGAYELEPSLGLMRVGAVVAPEDRPFFQKAIDRLGLNREDIQEDRLLRYRNYQNRKIVFSLLSEYYPFLAMELCRLGLLHPEDAHHTAAEVREWLDAEVDTLR